MPDREKVIKALEYCRNQAGCWSDESECPWIAECREDVNSLKDATLALLKEQEHGEWIAIWDKNDPDISTEGRCSVCKSVSERPLGHFCKWCGAIMNKE